MSDIIHILPPHIANQIAAGEVVQRPASVVKELIENSVDSGATSIHLVLKEAGKNLIQVIDNGIGMSAADAQVCFERHATSKISKAEDLFQIKTKGFRGEALSSIASVAQVLMQTKKMNDELGTQIEIKGNEAPQLQKIGCSSGTNMQVKNLFFNIPARRKFLKSDASELGHCIDQFVRVALIHPEIDFKLTHNATVVYDLKKGNLKQRIVGVLGKQQLDQLIPVETETEMVKISGYVLKPKSAKKSRGDQYLFVNNRYIRSPYLHHAIVSSFEEYIPEKYHPGYILSIQTDPAGIDINIHPTKTEIKFENEKIVYAIVKSAIQKGMAQYGVSPSLDFTAEQGFDIPFFDKNKPLVEPLISSNKNFNPFENESESSTYQEHKPEKSFSTHYAVKEAAQPWQNLFEQAQTTPEETISNGCIQLFKTYIATGFESSLLLIHQSRAHERILYDKFSKRFVNHARVTQQLLFPEQLEFSVGKYALLAEELPTLSAFGFDIEPFGKNTFVFRGIPTDLEVQDLAPFIDDILQTLEEGYPQEQKNKEIMASMAYKARIKINTTLSTTEMEHLVQELFLTSNPEFSPRKERIFHKIGPKDLEGYFG